MERIFASFKDSGTNTGVYDPEDPESYAQYIHALITDAQDYESDTLAGDRDYAQKYYYGLAAEPRRRREPLLRHDDRSGRQRDLQGSFRQTQDSVNRSKFVSTDVRDAVMLMLPSLIRLFGASESPIELVPRTAAESEQASQATNYVNYIFWNDNQGFLKLYGAFKDALTVKTGFLKWWTDTRKEFRRKTFTYITAQQIQQILTEDPTAKLVSIGNPVPPPPPPPQMQPPPQAGIPGMGPPGPAAAPMARRLAHLLPRRRWVRQVELLLAWAVLRLAALLLAPMPPPGAAARHAAAANAADRDLRRSGDFV